MGRVVVSQFISLDGVIEGPGVDESFDLSGWAFQFERGPEGTQFKFEEVISASCLLLGRVTYEGFASAWPTMEGTGEYGEKMNNMPKYVASTTLKQADWNNSTIISGPVPEYVAKLKQEADGDILVNGSGQLIQTLMEHNLIDEYRLMIYPIVLGRGKRLFPEGSRTTKLQPIQVRQAGDTTILVLEPEQTLTGRGRGGALLG